MFKSRRSVLSDITKRAISLATVRLTERQGQGVLVPGGFVITAAHCLRWDGEGGSALGDVHATDIRTHSGKRLRLDVGAAEPRADIAVLVELDEQEFGDEFDMFEQWKATTVPVPVRDEELEPDHPLRGHVLTHTGKWTTVTITRLSYGPTNGVIYVRAERPIRCGTSGGPVVDDEGRLLGVVSHFTEVTRGECDGFMPLVSLALPGWVMSRIARAQSEP